MRLLLTNDDGVHSVFLHFLVRALLAEGHSITVAAPRSEQSWIGAAKSRNRPVHVESIDLGLDCPTWSIDGTPSDCVNIALDHLLEAGWTPDGVLSGFNIGMNASLGFIIASGTIGGALEGALHGLPAVALSQDLDTEAFEAVKRDENALPAKIEETLRRSAKRAAWIAPELVANTARQSFLVHNLNFPYPGSADAPVRRTVPAHVLVPKLFTRANAEGKHKMIFRYGDDLSPSELRTDRAALAAQEISHSVLDYRRLGAE